MVIVTGHHGPGGNLGVNGIYERYPQDCEGRPVYFKSLEKRGAEDTDPELPLPMTDEDRLEKMRKQKAVDIPRQSLATRPTKLFVAAGKYFLYSRRGMWYIGPIVGSMEAFARCPSCDEAAPSDLTGWEVWDAGKHAYRPSHRMTCTKCGTAQAGTDAPLELWVPPNGCPRSRLPNDTW